MKKRFALVFALVLMLSLTACGKPSAIAGKSPIAAPDGIAATPVAPAPSQEEQGDAQMDLQAEKVQSAPIAVRSQAQAGEEPWEASLEGSDAAALEDLLCHLDYSEGICRCMPEYYAATETGAEYGISLTGSYARYCGGQVTLTEEQVKCIAEILDRQGK